MNPKPRTPWQALSFGKTATILEALRHTPIKAFEPGTLLGWVTSPDASTFDYGRPPMRAVTGDVQTMRPAAHPLFCGGACELEPHVLVESRGARAWEPLKNLRAVVKVTS